jgi:hypothetical protein
MRVSRRPLFFALVTVVALLMIPVTPSEYWWVNYFAAGLAAFWAVMLGIEELAAQRRNRTREDP